MACLCGTLESHPWRPRIQAHLGVHLIQGEEDALHNILTVHHLLGRGCGQAPGAAAVLLASPTVPRVVPANGPEQTVCHGGSVVYYSVLWCIAYLGQKPAGPGHGALVARQEGEGQDGDAALQHALHRIAPAIPEGGSGWAVGKEWAEFDQPCREGWIPEHPLQVGTLGSPGFKNNLPLGF